jgi:hypothetical protein
MIAASGLDMAASDALAEGREPCRFGVIHDPTSAPQQRASLSITSSARASSVGGERERELL